MKKTMMMAAILGVTALTAASFTGCSSAARTNTATKAVNLSMPVVNADTAAEKPATAATEAATEAATAAAVAAPTEAVTEAATEAPKTAAKAAKETKTETTESRDADFKWFTTGVYRVSIEDSDLDTYYVFSDKSNGRVDTVSGIGIAFTYTQSRSGVVFYMGEYADPNVMTITDASMNSFSGTMYGNNYTFTRVQDADPATFDAKAYANEKAQTCDDGQNPVMNFIGHYSNGRATMNVVAKGKNEAVVTVSWGSSAFETTKWIMSGSVFQVGNTLVLDYEDCDCESFFFSEDGTIEQSVVEYTNGSGSITFEGSQAVWADYEQGIADGQVFSYVLN